VPVRQIAESLFHQRDLSIELLFEHVVLKMLVVVITWNEEKYVRPKHLNPFVTTFPMKRYAVNGIRVFNMLDGGEVQLGSFTWEDHFRNIEKLAEYRDLIALVKSHAEK
jgi:hypothetical protein